MSKGNARGWRRSPVVVGAVVLAAFLTASCGDDDDSGSESADELVDGSADQPSVTDESSTEVSESAESVTTTEAAAPATESPSAATTLAPPSEPVTIRVQDAGPLLPTFPMYHAMAQGYFADEGLTLEFNEPVFSGGGIAQALITGDADISYGGAISNLPLVQQGQPIVSFGHLVDVVPDQVVLTNEAMDELAEAGVTVDSSIEEKVAALRGLTIATPPVGSSTETLFRTLVSSYGLDPDQDLTIQPLPDVPAILTAVREGRVDGNAGSASFTIPTEVAGDGVIFIDYTEAGPVVELPFMVYSTTPEFLAENPDVIERLLRATQHALDDIAAGLTEEQLTLLKDSYFAETDPEVFRQGMVTLPATVATSLVPTQAQFDNLVAAYNAAAEVPFDRTLSDVFDLALAEQIAANS